MNNNTRFKDGRLGIGRTPIFPLDVSGNTRIEGDLVLKGTIADASGVPIYFGHAGVTSTDGNNNNYHIGINKAAATDANFPLDVEGNVNINNGNLFINGGVAEFSNWTDIGNTEESGIYRNTKVAIGKTTANHILDVSGTVSIDGDILLNGTTLDPNPSVAALQDYTDTGPTWKDETIVTTVASSSDTTQALTTALNDKADKASPEFSGNVGIGKTADVNYALDVVGDINLTGALKLNGQTPTYSNWVVSGSDIYRDSGVTIGQNSVNNTSYKLYVNGDSHVQGTLSATTLDGNLEWSKIQNAPTTIVTSQSNAIVANTAKVSSQWVTGSSSKIYYNSGNVGVGTTSPDSRLTINGGGIRIIQSTHYTTSRPPFNSNSSSQADYEICAHKDQNAGYLRLKAGNNSNCSRIDLSAWTGSTAHECDRNITFYTNNTERIRIDANGNVGIGTASPGSYKLNVAGDINLTGTLYQNGSAFGGGIFKGVMSSSDNSILISGDESWNASTTGMYNTSLGWAAGYQMTSGEQNTLIGHNAGRDITSGGYNVAVGKSALLKCTTGRNNICIGYKSGEDLTTGQYNTCIGSAGGRNITSSESNTIMGYASAINLTTGNYNTIMGVNAGYNITTGTQNTCIGMQAGFSRNFSKCVFLGFDAMCYGTSDVTGTIAIGYQAGYREGSGNRNIYIGQQAGPFGSVSGRTCAENVVVGYHCGYKLTTGNYNIIVGRSAGHNITTGGYNVCLGHYAAVNATTTTHSICIGNSSGYSITTAANIIAIGDNALSKVTTAANSIAIGRYAGYGCRGGQNICIGYNVAYNTSTSNTGHNNVLMGQVTAYSLTSGYENVCIGREVAYYLSTGVRNVFMGTYAGYAESSAKNTANYNVGIGYNALRYVSSGGENVCIGYQAGKAITTGIRNVCIGRSGGEALTSGSYNVCIGMQSGDSLNVANNNVFIGYQAGEKITNYAANTFIGGQAGCYMTSGYNNVCLGHYAGASSGGGNYQLFINSYVGSYGTDSFIYGNMNMSNADTPYLRVNAKLGIGKEPTCGLDVNDSNKNCLRLTTVGSGWEGFQSNFRWGAHHIDVYNSSITKNFGDTGHSSSIHLNYYSGGGVVLAGGTNVTSDDRLKHNEEIIENALDVINKITAKKYFKSQKRYDEDHNYELDNSGVPITDDDYKIETGFIAQEVMTVPELKYLVTEIEDKTGDVNDYKKDNSGNFILDASGEKIKIGQHEEITVRGRYILRYNDLFCYNIAATQELYKENQELKTKVANLEAKLQSIEQRLAFAGF